MFYIYSIKNNNTMLNHEDYISKLEYPTRPNKPVLKVDATSQGVRDYADALEKYETEKKEYDEKRRIYSEDEARLLAKFKEDALKEVGIFGHESANRAYEYAWERGHAYGLYDVYLVLESIAYIITGK